MLAGGAFPGGPADALPPGLLVLLCPGGVRRVLRADPDASVRLRLDQLQRLVGLLGLVGEGFDQLGPSGCAAADIVHLGGHGPDLQRLVLDPGDQLERPGAQLSLFEEANGWRYQLIATNTPTGHLAFLEARHRTHARVEDNIHCAKNTGLGHLPSASFELNQARCLAAAIAADLLAWLRLLTLTGPLAKAEPKTLRYRLLHTAARLVRGQRKRKIKIPRTWPWARDLEACLLAALALPPPAWTPPPLPDRPERPTRPVEPAPTDPTVEPPTLTATPETTQERR